MSNECVLSNSFYLSLIKIYLSTVSEKNSHKIAILTSFRSILVSRNFVPVALLLWVMIEGIALRVFTFNSWYVGTAHWQDRHKKIWPLWKKTPDFIFNSLGSMITSCRFNRDYSQQKRVKIAFLRMKVHSSKAADVRYLILTSFS